MGCVLLPLACTPHQATLRKSACQPRQQATHPPVASARCALSAVNQQCHPKTLQHDAHRRQCEGEQARPASISLSQAHTLCLTPEMTNVVATRGALGLLGRALGTLASLEAPVDEVAARQEELALGLVQEDLYAFPTPHLLHLPRDPSHNTRLTPAFLLAIGGCCVFCSAVECCVPQGQGGDTTEPDCLKDDRHASEQANEPAKPRPCQWLGTKHWLCRSAGGSPVLRL